MNNQNALSYLAKVFQKLFLFLRFTVINLLVTPVTAGSSEQKLVAQKILYMLRCLYFTSVLRLF